MISKAKYALQKSFALQFFIGGQVVMQDRNIYRLNAGWSAELALIVAIQGLYLSNSSASSLSQCKAISKRLQHWIYSSNTPSILPAERTLYHSMDALMMRS